MKNKRKKRPRWRGLKTPIRARSIKWTSSRDDAEEKEEFEAKMRKERQKEEKKLTKRIEWFDDPVKDDDDDLWISDRQWQYDKNDPLMDFSDYEHETEEEKKMRLRPSFC